MGNVTQLKRKQVIDQSMIDKIRERLVLAEQGEITEMIYVDHDAEDGLYYRATEFSDGWRMLGALEYMKDVVIRAMGRE